jgi:hypothetical protein
MNGTSKVNLASQWDPICCWGQGEEGHWLVGLINQALMSDETNTGGKLDAKMSKGSGEGYWHWHWH